MTRRPRGSANDGRRKGEVLARLTPQEGAGVLRTILERHPELAAEAEEIAKATVTDVDAEAVAEDVEQAVLDLDLSELNSRAGRQECACWVSTDAGARTPSFSAGPRTSPRTPPVTR